MKTNSTTITANRLPNKIIILASLLILYTLFRFFESQISFDSDNQNLQVAFFRVDLPSTYATTRNFSVKSTVDYSKLYSSNKSIIIYDTGPCWWAVTHADISGHTGGETIFCGALMGHLIDTGKEVYITNNSKTLIAAMSHSHSKGRNLVAIIHWGYTSLSYRPFLSMEKLRYISPFIGKSCFLKLHFYGTIKPIEVWPGALNRYISVYPTILANTTILSKNSWFLFGDQFHSCGHTEALQILRSANRKLTHGEQSSSISVVDETVRSLVINSMRKDTFIPYVVIFGKWGTVVHETAVRAFLRGNTLWRNVTAHAKVIFLSCTPELFKILGTPPDIFLCLDGGSIFRKKPLYNLLLQRASVVVGIGAPLHSTTPFESLACHTPVVLPVGQHHFLDYMQRQLPHVYCVSTTTQFLTTLEGIVHGNGTRSKDRSLEGLPKELDGYFDRGKSNVLSAIEDTEKTCAKDISTSH